MKKISIEEKINIVASYTDDELNMSETVRAVVKELKNGVKISDIAKSLRISRQRVYQIINRLAEEKLLDKTKKEKTKKEKTIKKPVDKAEIFREYADLSCLSKRELQIVSVVLENPTATYKEIGNKIGISVSQVGSTIWSARKKILGKWDEESEKTRERAKEYAQSHPEKVRERKKKYYYENRDKWIDRMKEYNKKYYAENRERILQKQKEKKMKEQ